MEVYTRVFALDMAARLEVPFTRDGRNAAEVSEILIHLAFYSGWPNAMSAVSATKALFESRGVKEDALPAASPDLAPLTRRQKSSVQKRGKKCGTKISWLG